MTDWKPGDIALCIRGGIISPVSYGKKELPETGKFYKVGSLGCFEYLMISEDGSIGRSAALHLAYGPLNLCGRSIWAEKRFIKVTPQEEDEFDKEVIDLYNKKEVPNNVPKPKRVATTI